MTKLDLKHWYKYFNRRFFKNTLPHVCVKFGKLPTNGQSTVTGRSHFYGPQFNPYKITVNDKLRRLDTVCITVLLHEMAHIAIGGKYRHGKRFFREIDRLYRAGAYTKVRGGVL